MFSYNPEWNRFKYKQDELDKHNREIMSKDLQIHKSLFVSKEYKQIKSGLSSKENTINILDFYFVLTLRRYFHLNQFASGFIAHEWIAVHGKLNDRGGVVLPRPVVKHSLNWKKVAYGSKEIFGKGTDPIGSTYTLLVGVPTSHKSIITFFVEIVFSTHHRGIVKMPSKYIDLFKMEKGNRFVFMIHQGTDDLYDEQARYDLEANPALDIVTPEDAEEIHYGWN